MGRDDDDAIGVSDDDVSGKDRSISAADGLVDRNGLVVGQVRRARWAGVICRDVELGDGGGITEAAVGDDARTAAFHQPRDQYVPGRGGIRLFTAVHDQDVAFRAGFDGNALRMFGAAELGQLIAILSGGHVAQCEGGADHVLALPSDRMNALDNLVAQAPLEKGSGKCGDRNGHELVAGFAVHEFISWGGARGDMSAPAVPPEVFETKEGSAEVFGKDAFGHVLVADRSQETPDREGPDRGCAKVRAGRVGTAMNHGVRDLDAGGEAVDQDTARLAFQNRQQ